MCADACACVMTVDAGHNTRRYLHIEALFVFDAERDHRSGPSFKTLKPKPTAAQQRLSRIDPLLTVKGTDP
jgi:hypothetical protein